MTRQILVVANETVESDVLHETIYFLAHNPPREVLVVAPAGDRRGGAELRLRRSSTGSRTRASTHAAGSATATRCRRSRTSCACSRPTTS